MKHLIVFTLVLLGNSAIAQKPLSVDSLRLELEKYYDYDSAKISRLIILGNAVEDKTKKIEIFNEAYRQAKSRNYLELLHSAADNLGYVYYFGGEYAEAEKYYIECLEIARSNLTPVHVASTLLDLAQVEEFLSKDESSLRHTLEGIEILEKTDAYDKLATGYLNVGGFYYYRDKTEEALEYFLSAKDVMLAYVDLTVEYSLMATIEINIGWCYYYLSDLAQSIAQLQGAVEIHNKYDYYSPASGMSRSTLASIYIETEQYDLARVHAKDGLDICEQADYTYGIGNSHMVLGDIEYAAGNYRSATTSYLLGLAYADSTEDLYEQATRSDQVAKGYREMGNYQQAYNFITQAKMYNDSLTQLETDAAFEDAITKYETEKAEAENALLQKETELKDIQIDQERRDASAKQERNFIVGGAIGLVLILGLFFLINRNRLKTRINTQLEIQRDEIAEQKQEITDSITYAKRIQSSFLPHEKDFESHFAESFLMYQPKDIVAGDFYILEEVEDFVFFSVADCTGHGVPGAMVSIVCSNAIRKVLHELHEYDPGKVLDMTRDIVIEQFERKGHVVNDGMDISFCRLHKKTNTLAWAGANSALLIINSNGVLNEVKPTKQPIGGYVTNDPFTSHEIKLEKGDRIYMSSDGYPDQFGGEKGKKYKYKRFKELLLRNHKETMQKQKSLISSEFWEWKQGIEQIDDVCVMGVRV